VGDLVLFTVGQITGSIAPVLYGTLIGDRADSGPLTIGYFVCAGVMIIGAVVAFIFGVDAERRLLESLTSPLSTVNPTVALLPGRSRSAGPVAEPSESVVLTSA
jgi:hypothetical protein